MGNKKEFNDFTRIRYDKKMIRLIVIIVVVNTLITVSGIILAGIPASSYLNSTTSSSEFYLIVAVATIILLSFIFLIVFGFVLIEGLEYLRKLKKMGYIIPENRKLYQYDLRKVPRLLPEEEVRIKPIRSVVFAIVFAMGFIMCIIYDVILINEWSFLGKDRVSLLLLGSIVNCVWLILIFYFARQQNQRKYREDYEIDDSRVERTSILLAVVIIIPLLIFTLVSKEVSETLLRKCYNSCIEHDEAQLGDIGKVMWNIYLYRSKDPTFEESNKRIYEVFEQGFNITEFGEPQNSYLKEVAQCLEIESFDELNELIYLSEGDAKIHIILKGDELTVTLLNPVESNKEFGVYEKVDIKYLEEMQKHFGQSW